MLHHYVQDFAPQVQNDHKLFQNLFGGMPDGKNPLGERIRTVAPAEKVAPVCGKNIVVFRTHQGDVLNNHLAAYMEGGCQSRPGQGNILDFEHLQDLISPFFSGHNQHPLRKNYIRCIIFSQPCQILLDKIPYLYIMVTS